MPHNPILDSLPSQLSEEATRFLTDYGHRVNFKAGEIVVREGAPCNAVYIVLGGKAQIVKRDSLGNSNVIALAEPGSIIGEMAVFMDLKRSASIIAEGPLALLELANADFATALLNFPALSVRMLRSLSGKLNDLNQRLINSLQSQHALYLGMHLLEQQAHNNDAVQPLKLNLISLAEQAGLQTLDIRNTLTGFQRRQLISDLHISSNDHAHCRIQEEALRAYLAHGAHEA